MGKKLKRLRHKWARERAQAAVEAAEAVAPVVETVAPAPVVEEVAPAPVIKPKKKFGRTKRTRNTSKE
tara:strand:+ start:135 stop:338 length:204 start_codon:yes stop_codon:yes gene_type:complete